MRFLGAVARQFSIGMVCYTSISFFKKLAGV